MDYLNIGCTPPDEPCVQVGHDDYDKGSRIETLVYKDQLARMFPEGRFTVKSFPHDFGTYREVVAYLTGDEATDKAAFDAEGGGPLNWDEIALKMLAERGYHKCECRLCGLQFISLNGSKEVCVDCGE